MSLDQVFFRKNTKITIHYRIIFYFLEFTISPFWGHPGCEADSPAATQSPGLDSGDMTASRDSGPGRPCNPPCVRRGEFENPQRQACGKKWLCTQAWVVRIQGLCAGLVRSCAPSVNACARGLCAKGLCANAIRVVRFELHKGFCLCASPFFAPHKLFGVVRICFTGAARNLFFVDDSD